MAAIIYMSSGTYKQLKLKRANNQPTFKSLEDKGLHNIIITSLLTSRFLYLLDIRTLLLEDMSMRMKRTTKPEHDACTISLFNDLCISQPKAFF